MPVISSLCDLRNFEADRPWWSAMWRGRGSSVESLLELRGGPRLDEAQADFRLLASSHTRLEKKHHIGVCSFVPKSPAAHRRRWSGSCHVLVLEPRIFSRLEKP